MITFTMLTLGLALLVAAMAIMSIAMAQQPILETVGGSHFGRVGFDPAADTLNCGGHTEKTLDGDWGKVDLNRLCDVEALLDCLEASNATKTELEIADNDHFTVRFR